MLANQYNIIMCMIYLTVRRYLDNQHSRFKSTQNYYVFENRLNIFLLNHYYTRIPYSTYTSSLSSQVMNINFISHITFVSFSHLFKCAMNEIEFISHSICQSIHTVADALQQQTGRSYNELLVLIYHQQVIDLCTDISSMSINKYRSTAFKNLNFALFLNYNFNLDIVLRKITEEDRLIFRLLGFHFKTPVYQHVASLKNGQILIQGVCLQGPFLRSLEQIKF